MQVASLRVSGDILTMNGKHKTETVSVQIKLSPQVLPY